MSSNKSIMYWGYDDLTNISKEESNEFEYKSSKVPLDN